jgi:hypothetical protein
MDPSLQRPLLGWPVTRPGEVAGEVAESGREGAAVMLSTGMQRKIQEQEAYAILLEMQRQEERAGTIPDLPLLILRRYARFLEYIGGILFGIILGVMALLLNFILFNKMLHLQF